MKNKQVENKVEKGFNAATPDQWNAIETDCANVAVTRPQNTRKTSFGWKFATICLAFALLVVGVWGGVTVGTETAAAATVSLDVNPSIEIVLNGNNKVVKVVANNADAELILDGMDLKGCTVQVAVNAIVGSMYSKGYLTEWANSVLVGVDAKEAIKDELIKTVTEQITVTLKGNAIDANVVSTWLTGNSDAKKIASDYGISLGKAELITKILAADTSKTHTAETLAALKINDLTLILQGLVTEKVGTGEASDKSYIGQNAAEQIAFEAVGEGVNAQTVSKLKTKMDFEDGSMVYEVEFVYDGIEYEFEIEAVFGTIVKREVEKKHRTPVGTEKITPEQALQLAYDRAGVTDSSQVEKLKTETDREDGEIVYEIEFVFSGAEYEFEIGEYGTIYQQKTKIVKTSQSGRQDDAFYKTLVDKYLGINEADITEFEVEFDDDHGKKTVVEVEFVAGGYEYALKIDVNTNSVLKCFKKRA